MNISRIILGIIAGAFFTGIAFSIISYLNTINDHSSTLLGPASDWWRLALITGAILGGIVGGISAVVIINLQLNTFKAVLFGSITNLFIVLLLAQFESGEKSLTYTYFVSIVTGAINGAIVSLINLWQKAPE